MKLSNSMVRKACNFAAPALLLGLLFSPQAFGLTRAVTRLENSIDALLAKEDVDIRLQNRLVTTQNAISSNIAGLENQLANTTDPAKQAQLEAQIAQKQAQYNQFQRAINSQGLVLQRDLTVVVPAKDNAMRVLAGLNQNVNQVRMFLTAATQRENVYTNTINLFLKAHPVTPVAPF